MIKFKTEMTQNINWYFITLITGKTEVSRHTENRQITTKQQNDDNTKLKTKKRHNDPWTEISWNHLHP